jgi:hypothetical protein
MIDVQIVAGKDPRYAREATRRVLDQDAAVDQIFILNQTGHPLTFPDERVTVVDQSEKASFEVNHNRLAKFGTNPFILFLDDDAFLFPQAISKLMQAISERKSVTVVGALNNQSNPRTPSGKSLPTATDLQEFQRREEEFALVAGSYPDALVPRIFLPGNCLLVRRRVWQKEYGGWDEGYQNWDEEVDFILWCRERGYESLLHAGVWFFHCHGRSRSREQLLANIVQSSGHFLSKWPPERLRQIVQGNPMLGQEIEQIFTLNRTNANESLAEVTDYYRFMQTLLPSETT